MPLYIYPMTAEWCCWSVFAYVFSHRHEPYVACFRTLNHSWYSNIFINAGTTLYIVFTT